MKQSKKKFAILLGGKPVGYSYAASPEKAINNYWWKNDKKCSQYTIAKYYPSDYDAVEVI